jgi:hypothetical protein
MGALRQFAIRHWLALMLTVTYYTEMVLRFVILFVGLVAIQLLTLHFVNGFERIYAPFIDLIEPFVRRHYGGGDGTLGPLLFWGLLLGISVYSAVLTVAGAFLIGRGLSKLQ